MKGGFWLGMVMLFIALISIFLVMLFAGWFMYTSGTLNIIS